MIQRRHLLAMSAGMLALPCGVQAHNAVGLVNPPLPSPPVPVQLHTGRNTTLAEIFKGRATALQLMFTGCSATCPIQGALFAAAQEKLVSLKSPGVPIQLISFSIDPLADGPTQLQRWLKSFDAGAVWQAASPGMKALDPFLDFLQGRSKKVDRHTGQVYFFDQRGRLALRSIDFPPANLIVQRLTELAVLA